MSEICTKCDLHLSAESICMKGYGNPSAKVMIIGGSPGFKEDEIGKPFQGKVGKVLDRVLQAQKVTRESIFLTNVVRCKPPKSKSPKKKEIGACREWLLAEIERVNPDFILVLGNTAAKGVFNELSKFKMGDIRGRFTERDGRMYFATYHPSVEISGISKYLKIMESDFKRFFEVVKLGKLPEGDKLNLTIVNSIEDYEEFLKVLRKEDEVAFDIETTGLVPWEGNIVSLGFGFKDQEFVIPMNHSEGWIDNEYDEQSSLCEEIEEILQGKILIAHNGKFDTLWTKVQYGMDLSLDHDTMLLSHLLDENTGNGLKYLSETLLGAENYEIPLSAKMGETTLELLSEYNAWDVYYTLRLYKRFIKELKEDPALCKFYEYVTMPAARYFRDIEYQGVYINLEKLDLVEEKYEKKVEALAEELEKIKPGVNWNSPKQVSNFLFKDLRLTPLEKTRSGGFSTAESVMQRLARSHPAPKKILELRGARKMLSTFLSSWKEKEIDSRLHPSFKLHGTVTGRLSCSNPNLQQVPRDPEIRSLVSSPKGWTLIEADFSQIELRIAAILSGDKAMQKAFNNGEDIHTKTAIMVSGIDPTGMNKQELKEWRKKAKACFVGDTEVLTLEGWVKFEEYNGIIPLAQYDQSKDEVSFVKPIEFKSFNNREIVHIKDRNTDLMLTPDHELIWLNKHKKLYEGPIGKVKPDSMYYLINSGNYTYTQLRLSEIETRILAMIVSDGNCRDYWVRFSFAKERKIQRCKDLLDKADFSYNLKVRKNGITTINFKEREYYKKILRYITDQEVQLYDSVKKTLLWNTLTEINGSWYLDEARHWDGHQRVKQKGVDITFTSSVKQITEVMQAMACINGLRSITSCTVPGMNRLGYNTQSKYTFVGNTDVKPLKEKAKVYCVQVPQGNILVRRNGKVTVTKNCNFGFLYGMGAKKFQEYAGDKYDINYGIEECKNIRDRFFKSYSGLRPWYERQYRIAKMNSGVRSLLGRIRHLPDIHSGDGFLRSQAERQSINAPVQSFASDLTIMAVIEIMSTFGEGTLNIVGTVHDAILIEIKDERLEDVIPRIKHIMENPTILEEFGIKLPIPIIADIAVGDWGAGKEWEEKS